MDENKDIPVRSSLQDKTSDIVGKGYVKVSDNFKLTNEFSIDQNLNELNYNEFGANLIMGNTNFNIKYLEENNHIGSTNYVKSDLKVEINNSNEMQIDFRRILRLSRQNFIV